jgi:D-glycerate 3-kinase
LFEYKGLKAASVSIDDFYLTREDHVAMSKRNQGNRILETRGNAGSHDVRLGTQTLKTLKDTNVTTEIALPRYDKSAHQGKGDRADPSTWPTVQGPVDVVLFEGWMLGFTPVRDRDAAAVDPDLRVVNRFLKEYKNAWDRFVDSWLVIKVANPEYSHKWRLQAEKRMRAAGKPAMTDEEVEAFVDRFMPAYRCYLPGLYEKGPTTANIQDANVLVVEVDETRSPVANQ